MANDYTPEWYLFTMKTLNPPKEDGKLNPKDPNDKFWIKVQELRNKKIKCNCDNDECDTSLYCTKCFLEKEKRAKWQWYASAENSSKRWLCVNQDIIDAMNNHNVNFYAFNMGVYYRGDIWKTMRQFFWEKQLEECAECQEIIDLDFAELHHIVEKVNGGKENLENLQILCKTCHRAKALSIYEMEGYL